MFKRLESKGTKGWQFADTRVLSDYNRKERGISLVNTEGSEGYGG